MLAPRRLGRGPATEAARVSRDLACDRLGLDRLISVTIEANPRSSRVMEKLGMSRWRTMPFEGWTLPVWAKIAADRPS
jgi:RimJ/RimL family protein N-acetyltransferase